MQKLHSPAVEESERLELEAVVASLERTPKLAGLMRYLADTYFAGDSDHLTEYNIATEVFGRSKSTFIASEDSVARVQTHRLRKRLKEYYDSEGRAHVVQISIPLGTYVPVFSRHSTFGSQQQSPPPVEVEVRIASIDEHAASGESDDGIDPISLAQTVTTDEETVARSAFGSVSRAKVLALASIVLLIIVGFVIARLRRQDAVPPAHVLSAARSAEPQVKVEPSGTGPGMGTAIPLRVIAGYEGPPERDSSGEIWGADRYFHEGWGGQRRAGFIARASDQFIFGYGRSGGFDYDIPLASGLYELHLYFLAYSKTQQSEDAEEQSVFNLAMNGKVVLPSFDIVSDAMGRDIADERIIRDVSPASDGKLHLHFSSVIGLPFLSAIQILKGTPGKQLPIRIIAQPTPFTDHLGTFWRPDNYFMGGRHLSHNVSSATGLDSDLQTVERYGHFSYAFPVDPREHYTVVLHFNELFFGSELSPNSGAAGNRVFRVICNGAVLLDNFDIYKEAGADNPLEKVFHNLRPTAQGKLNLTFEPLVNYATVSAIEVIDEGS